MTYILARRIGDATTIIADSLVTRIRRGAPVEHSPFGFKLGVLFEGCIFGAAGDQEEIYDFLMRAKDYVLPFPQPNRWEQFCLFARTYTYPRGDDRFIIVFSSRHAGLPALYLLHSEAGVIEAAGDSQSFGSGESALDAHVEALENSRLDPRKAVARGEAKAREVGCAYCLFLNEISLGAERTILREENVGGWFSYIRQDANGESWQGAVIYALVEPRVGGGFNLDWVRTAVYENCFFVTRPSSTGSENALYTNAVVRPDLFGLTGRPDEAEMTRISDAANDERLRNPYDWLVVGNLNRRRPPIWIYYDQPGGFDFNRGPQGGLSGLIQEMFARIPA